MAESDASLPINIVNFAWRYLLSIVYQMVPINKWKQKETSNCQLCQYTETLLRLFNHCTASLNYTNGDTTLSSTQLSITLSQSLLIQGDCMLISMCMNVHGPYSRVEDQNKCWNVTAQTWHYNSRKKLYCCNRI